MVEQRWAKVIDQNSCIGCHACTVACKAEHLVPLGVTRTYVKQVEIGRFPAVRRHFQVTRCNHCANPPCVHICPVGAMRRRPDGIVDFDRDACIGCKACIAACPYDAIYIDPRSRSAEKCNFCVHRLEVGLEPACVAVCPERAIVVGNLYDHDSEVAMLAARAGAEVRKPEKGTRPGVFYVGAAAATRVPGAARREGAFLWATDPVAANGSNGYAPAAAGGVVRAPAEGVAPAAVLPAGGTAADARLVYDFPSQAPWDWRVSAYTYTKSVAAGAFLVPALLPGAGGGAGAAAGWGGGAGPGLLSPLLGLAFLVMTALFLVLDLSHPERFLRVMLRPQWRSWLARGAYILVGYGAVLALAAAAAWLDLPALAAAVRFPGMVLAALTAVYTAFLLGQAKGRDLWQSPVLPAHLLAQAFLAGAALFAVAGPASTGALPPAAALAAGGALHFALALGEVLMTHPTTDARAAAAALTRGAFAPWYWAGVVLAGVLPLLAPAAAPAALPFFGAAALAGLFAHEHAYLQAGQAVRLR